MATTTKTGTTKPAAAKPSAAKTATPRKTQLSGIKAAVKEADAEKVSATTTVTPSASIVAAIVSADAPRVYERKVDSKNRAYATGKRKNAIARVWVMPGNGKITVNGRDVKTYFARPVLQMIVNQPFVVADRAGQFDVFCTVVGGGLSGQAGAVKHGISKALTCFEPELRTPLKAALFLRRDPRAVERKKYGRAKARRRFQFSKR